MTEFWEVQGQGRSSLHTHLREVHQICLFHRLWATATKLKRIDGSHNDRWQAEAKLGLLADAQHMSPDKSEWEKSFYSPLILPQGSMKAVVAEIRHKSRARLKGFVMVRASQSLSIYSSFYVLSFLMYWRGIIDNAPPISYLPHIKPTLPFSLMFLNSSVSLGRSSAINRFL